MVEDPSKEIHEANLLTAIQFGKTERVVQLLNEGVSPVFCADLFEEHKRMAQYAEAERARQEDSDDEEDNDTKDSEAQKHADLLTMLIGTTPLFQAILYNRPQIVEILLKQKTQNNEDAFTFKKLRESFENAGDSSNALFLNIFFAVAQMNDKKSQLEIVDYFVNIGRLNLDKKVIKNLGGFSSMVQHLCLPGQAPDASTIKEAQSLIGDEGYISIRHLLKCLATTKPAIPGNDKKAAELLEAFDKAELIFRQKTSGALQSADDKIASGIKSKQGPQKKVVPTPSLLRQFLSPATRADVEESEKKSKEDKPTKPKSPPKKPPSGP